MVSGAAKRVFETALVRGGAARLARSTRRGRSLVLAYHNIVPNGLQPAGEASLHLPQRRFAAQLDVLLRTHEVVPLESLLNGDSRLNSRPRVAITFDDAYRGAVTAGVVELAKRGLPATIFVAPDFLGGRSFWWDVLSEPGRERALREFDGRDEAIRTWALESGFPTADPPNHCTAASEEELEKCLEHPGISLGSHSWTHPNLPRLEGVEVEEELRRSIEWLTARFHRVIPWLAYPYGLSSPTVAEMAAGAGYEAALKIDGGWFPSTNVNKYALPRLNIPAGLSDAGFTARVSGLLCNR